MGWRLPTSSSRLEGKHNAVTRVFFLHAPPKESERSLPTLCCSFRNPDFKTVTLELDGEVKLNFAIANGFRNIQNFIRALKKGSSPYHYVEVRTPVRRGLGQTSFTTSDRTALSLSLALALGDGVSFRLSKRRRPNQAAGEGPSSQQRTRKEA
jgi:hypothetical protein